MIPLEKVRTLVIKHDDLEKELSTGTIDPKTFAQKSKEYSELGNIVSYAREYLKFENDQKEFLIYKKEYNHCPYCRKNGDYLPLVNGVKKVIPNVHCMNTTKSIQDKKIILKNEYSTKCVFILTRGKNKGSECGKNCVLGYTNCKAHLK